MKNLASELADEVDQDCDKLYTLLIIDTSTYWDAIFSDLLLWSITTVHTKYMKVSLLLHFRMESHKC